MIDRNKTFLELRKIMEALGVHVGREVMDVWRDRELHGDEALPPEALKSLAELTARLIEESPAVNPWWPLLGEAVRAPLPYPWHPSWEPPVDEATLRRIIAGLEHLAAQPARCG